jgi:hypothetical protein
VAKKRKVKVKEKLVTRTTTSVTVAAELSENQKGIGGIKVTFLESLTPNANGFRPAIAFKTDADGFVAIAGTLTRTVYFKVTAILGNRSLGTGACTPTFGAVPCIQATVAGQTLTSRVIKLVIRH